MRSTNRSSAGFSLLELLLASSIGLILFGVGMTLLMGDAKRSAAMAAALQGRRWQRRTLALIQGRPGTGRQLADRSGTVHQLALCPGWTSSPPGDQAPRWFSTSGVCHWRGAITDLARSGVGALRTGLRPGGSPLEGAYQNRVVLDGVDRFGVIPHPDLPVLQLELEQRRGDQLIRSLGVG